MNRKNPLRWLFVLLLLLSLPALACGLTGGDDEEPTAAPVVTAPEDDAAEDDEPEAELTDTPEAEPTDTPEAEPTDAPEPAGEAPAFPDLDTANANLEEFNSYRAEMVLAFEGLETSESGTMRFQSARVVEPYASEVIMTLEGALPEDMEGIDSLSFTEIGDTAYTVFPGFGCISGGIDEMGGTSGEIGDIMDTEELLGGIDDADYVGEETIDGVATFHYQFDETNVEDSEDVDELDGHVYISQEDGYVVRMVIDGTGQLDLFGEEGETQDSNIHIEYNVTEVNTDIVIEPPADCEDSGTEFPVMEGATGTTSMSGFTSYQVEASLDEVVAFYDEEMSALGYTPSDEQMVFEDSALLTYTQGEETVNVTVSDEDGVVSVLISSEIE